MILRQKQLLECFVLFFNCTLLLRNYLHQLSSLTIIEWGGGINDARTQFGFPTFSLPIPKINHLQQKTHIQHTVMGIEIAQHNFLRRIAFKVHLPECTYSYNDILSYLSISTQTNRKKKADILTFKKSFKQLRNCDMSVFNYFQ